MEPRRQCRPHPITAALTSDQAATGIEPAAGTATDSPSEPAAGNFGRRLRDRPCMRPHDLTSHRMTSGTPDHAVEAPLVEAKGGGSGFTGTARFSSDDDRDHGADAMRQCLKHQGDDRGGTRRCTAPGRPMAKAAQRRRRDGNTRQARCGARARFNSGARHRGGGQRQAPSNQVASIKEAPFFGRRGPQGANAKRAANGAQGHFRSDPGGSFGAPAFRERTATSTMFAATMPRVASAKRPTPTAVAKLAALRPSSRRYRSATGDHPVSENRQRIDRWL